MALKPCIECKREVSTEAKSCPHCGKSNPTTTGLSSGAKLFLAIVGLAMVASFASSGSSPSSNVSMGVADPAAAAAAEKAEAERRSRERPKADSFFTATPASKLKAQPDSVLGWALAYADSGRNPTRFVAARNEMTARRARADLDRRAASVLSSARSSSTVDGKGCTNASRARAERLVKAHGEWSDDILGVIMCGWVQRGMTSAQLIASWGRPEDINRTVGSWGVHEQWVYGEYGGPYVYLEDGIVTSWQN